jgi:hypothetical protein
MRGERAKPPSDKTKKTGNANPALPAGQKRLKGGTVKPHRSRRKPLGVPFHPTTKLSGAAQNLGRSHTPKSRGANKEKKNAREFVGQQLKDLKRGR